MIRHPEADDQTTQPSARIEVRVVSDGWGRPRTMRVRPDDLWRIVADYARRTHVIEVIATIDGREVVTPGPRAREFAAACRRARIVHAATVNRAGGIALLTALVDTPHQRDLVRELGAALFPDGEEVAV